MLIYKIKQDGKWRIWKNISIGLLTVYAALVVMLTMHLNRYLKKLCVTENLAGRMHRCILRLPGSFMEPITVHAPTETVPGTPCPSPPRYPH